MTALSGSSKNVMVWIGIVGLLVAVTIAWFVLPTGEWLQAFIDWTKSFGIAGVLVFAVVYVVTVIVLAPASVLTITAGVVYGAWAFPLVIVAATTGATLAFLISRYLVRQKVESVVKDRPKFKVVDDVVSEDGWKIVGLVRLSPLVPFNLQNYFFGVTNVGLLPYLVATFFGIMPGTALYVYIGSIGKAAVGQGGGGLAKWFLLGAGLVATAVVAIIITRKAKQKLEQAVNK